jgi:hypothetical protein
MCPDPPDEHDIERYIERSGDLEAERDAATR